MFVAARVLSRGAMARYATNVPTSFAEACPQISVLKSLSMEAVPKDSEALWLCAIGLPAVHGAPAHARSFFPPRGSGTYAEYPEFQTAISLVGAAHVPMCTQDDGLETTVLL